MGNTTSHTNQNRPSPVPARRLDSPARRQPHSHSPSPNSNQPHRSLRTKKKSLELPDLAMLSLTPAHSHQNSANSSPLSQYRRPPRTSSPIPIPIPTSNNGTINNASNTGTSPRGRQPIVKTNIARDTDAANYSAELLLEQPPSTHIPVHHHHRPRGSPYYRGVPSRYNSTYSFASRAQSAAQPRMQEIYAESQVETSTEPDHQQEFVQETVHSTIPLALLKAEEELAVGDAYGLQQSGQHVASQPFDEPKEPVNVKITWRGGGKSVVLARAGDDNWKGRQPMEPDDSQTDTSWSTWVSLIPGTHHIRFIVDEQWRIADDLPTAVDDEGSLANYVAIPVSGLTPPRASGGSGTPAKQSAQPHVLSFWSSTTSTHASVADVHSASDPNGLLAKWTEEIPAELVAAAREEEAYLAYTAEYDQPGSASGQHHVPAPNIPPAPILPRHLDKLILNAKAGQPSTSTRGREKEKEREHRRKQGRSIPSMTGIIHKEEKLGEVDHPIPITTASGTDVTTARLPIPSQAHSRLGLEGPGMTDDASVLPVPSHVVLHHLSTSAIRNGVLAVGNTIRYRQKFLTTIYYKPTFEPTSGKTR